MISLLVPSRGRPEWFGRMIASAWRTAYGDVEVVARLDYDDPTIEHYHDECYAWGVIRFLAPRQLPNTQQNWNQAATLASGDILGFLADDVLFETRGWDEMVTEAFTRWPDRIGLVNGFDGRHGEDLATHGFISREWYDVVGAVMPPMLDGFDADGWITARAKTIGRHCFLPDLKMTHLCAVYGLADADDTYNEKLARRASPSFAGTESLEFRQWSDEAHRRLCDAVGWTQENWSRQIAEGAIRIPEGENPENYLRPGGRWGHA